MMLRLRGLAILVAMVGCGGVGEPGEEEGESGSEMPPGDEQGVFPQWMAVAKVGRMEGSEFVEMASRELGPEGVPAPAGLVQASFGTIRDIIVALPTPGDLRRLNLPLSEEIAVETLQEAAVAALDLDGDGLDEVVNFGGSLRPAQFVLVPGTRSASDWGPALTYPLSYQPERFALVPGSSSRRPGIVICHESPTTTPAPHPVPGTLVVLEWRDNELTERWSVTVEESFCGSMITAAVGDEQLIVSHMLENSILAFREGIEAPFARFDTGGGLAVADLHGDGTPMVVISSLVQATDTVQDYEITAVPLTEVGFGEPVTMETTWLASFSTGDVDGDGADELVLAQVSGLLMIADLVEDQLTISGEHIFEDLRYARVHTGWAAVPMDLSDETADELVVVGYPYEVED